MTSEWRLLRLEFGISGKIKKWFFRLPNLPIPITTLLVPYYNQEDFGYLELTDLKMYFCNA